MQTRATAPTASSQYYLVNPHSAGAAPATHSHYEHELQDYPANYVAHRQPYYPDGQTQYDPPYMYAFPYHQPPPPLRYAYFMPGDPHRNAVPPYFQPYGQQQGYQGNLQPIIPLHHQERMSVQNTSLPADPYQQIETRQARLLPADTTFQGNLQDTSTRHQERLVENTSLHADPPQPFSSQTGQRRQPGSTNFPQNLEHTPTRSQERISVDNTSPPDPHQHSNQNPMLPNSAIGVPLHDRMGPSSDLMVSQQTQQLTQPGSTQQDSGSQDGSYGIQPQSGNHSACTSHQRSAAQLGQEVNRSTHVTHAGQEVNRSTGSGDGGTSVQRQDGLDSIPPGDVQDVSELERNFGSLKVEGKYISVHVGSNFADYSNVYLFSKI